MELRKNLELVEVEIESSKAMLTFLDEEMGVIREVQFNKQAWDNDLKKFVDNEEKAKKVEEWCQEYFGCTFDELQTKVGAKKDVYVYDKFCSLWESTGTAVNKFDEDMVGELLEVVITRIHDDNIGIHIVFDYEGKEYESKMTYAKYIDSLKKYVVDPIKKEKQIEKFEEKFGVTYANKDELLGKTIIVEVKKALGKYVYTEVKKAKKK